VRNLLAQTYPELAQATWTETPQADGSVLIEFVKVAGEKGQQSSFFDEQASGFPPRQQQPSQSSPPPTNGPVQRIFIVNGQVWGDPGPEYTITQIRDSFAQTYPELSQATWTSRLMPDGTEEITFVKVSGEKGRLKDD
jgi:PRTRC genetic system protein C